jgi:hypothetical protein
MAWNGFPGNSITATGFAAAWPHRAALIGSGDRAQANDDAPIAIKMIATSDCLVRLQIIAVDAAAESIRTA